VAIREHITNGSPTIACLFKRTVAGGAQAQIMSSEIGWDWNGRAKPCQTALQKSVT